MIDFDNVTMGIRSDLQNQLRKLLNSEIIKGKVAVQRAYADWRRYPQYIVPLSEASIDLIFAPAFGSNKKNATDIRLAIDALELVFTRPEIGTFILLSGDSDFSSLVLKLKEYGKYIIGVGIRESSSDLLIQNCDEYYSYTEVTGLTKEGDLEGARRNPWELVVEAVSQMKREDDVMRSDRLKQVMQTIDSNFDEKDAGFSRFSKFVVEAGRRGLLSLEKMENGQYAIDVGDDANVPPEEEAELRRAAPAQEAPKPRRRRPRRREPDTERGLTLAAAFDLLRRTLAEFEDSRGPGAAAEDVYARMIEAHGDPAEPMFERPRFQRLLRQAHDAQVVELAKVDDTYRLKAGAEAAPVEPQEPESAPARQPTAGRESRAKGESVPEAAVADHPAEQGAGEARKPSRGRSRSPRKRAAPKDEERSEQPRTQERAPVPPPPRDAERAADQHAAARDAGAPKTDAAARKRNPRFRRGSRGAPTARPATGAGEKDTARKEAAPTESAPSPAPGAKPAKSAEPAAAGDSQPSRTVRTRRGGRGRGRGGKAEAATGEKPAPPAHAESERPPRATPPPAESRVTDAPPVTAAPPNAPQQGSLFEGAPSEEGSLFRRMTAALQRVMRGPESEE
jgi:uncharacterized protein (TIGR00288 family)